MFLGITPHESGLPRLVFNKHLDALLKTGKLNPDIIPLLNRDQQLVINEVKKSLKRMT